jgi:hypothetical protein
LAQAFFQPRSLSAAEVEEVEAAGEIDVGEPLPHGHAESVDSHDRSPIPEAVCVD